MLQNNESRFIPTHPAPEDGVQVGGHGGKGALIISGDKCKKPCASKELKFYEATQAEGPIKMYHDAHLIPQFYGVEQTQVDGETVNYVVMENLTFGFNKPVIVDLKMGTQTWDEDCRPAKLANHKEIDAATTTASLGFRFGGMMTYNAVEKKSQKYPKTFGLNATAETMCDYLEKYLANGTEKPRTDVIPFFIDELKRHLDFAKRRLLRFHASSLVHIYEGDVTAKAPKKPVVKFLDFAHYWSYDEQDKERYDAGLDFGISNLIACWDKIYKKYN